MLPRRFRLAAGSVLFAAAAAVLSGCVSPQEEAMANSVITALPQEVQGCTFLGDVDSVSRATIGSARFEVKLQTAKMGGTHVVETYAYPMMLSWPDFGIAITGRAYRCPAGKGPIVDNPEGKLPAPELPHIMYDIHDHL